MPARAEGRILIALIAALLPLLAGAAAPDPRVKPGATFYIEIPGFGRMAQGGEGSVGVYIPTDYTPDRRFPLLTWFGGGDGGSSPNAPRSITGGSGFICVGLPYHTPPGGGQGGWAATSWQDYRAMLDLVEKAVPNIDPANRISAGFSSGGAAVTKMVAESGGGYQDYFYALMPGGSATTAENARSMKGRPVLFFMGDQDMRFSGFSRLYDQYLAAGVDAKFLVFKGVGHDMPGSYFPQMREWIVNKVLRRNLPQTAKAMRMAFAAREWRHAMGLARDVQAVADPADPAFAEAGQVVSNVSAAAKAEMIRLVQGGAPAAKLRQFARDWRAEPFVQPLWSSCNEQGEKELAPLAAQKPIPHAALRTFMEEYEAFEVCAKARALYAQAGDEILVQLLAQPALAPEKLKRFMDLWTGYPAEARARDAFAPMAEKALAQYRKTPNPDTRRMMEFIAAWSPSSSADAVKEELEKKAEQELAAINGIPQKMLREGRLQMFRQTYRGTAAAEEAGRPVKQQTSY